LKRRNLLSAPDCCSTCSDVISSLGKV